MQSRNVPCLFASVVHDRGNISYHAPNRALTGSTIIASSFSYRVSALRSRLRSITTKPHPGAAPRRLPTPPVKQHRSQPLVPVRENVRSNANAVPNRAFDRKRSIIDLRLDTLDHHASQRAHQLTCQDGWCVQRSSPIGRSSGKYDRLAGGLRAYRGKTLQQLYIRQHTDFTPAPIYSPYGTRIFFTCVACWRNHRPSPC